MGKLGNPGAWPLLIVLLLLANVYVFGALWFCDIIEAQ